MEYRVMWERLRGPAVRIAVALLLFTISSFASNAQSIDLDAQRLHLTPVDVQWRFHAGDDARWAQPDFDDSGWKLMAPRNDWPTQGYASEQELAWFRFKILVPPNTPSLALQLARFDRNYQLFADGKLIGQVGSLPPEIPVSVSGAARVFTLPVHASPNPQPMTIAIRLWQEPQLAGVRGDRANGRTYVGEPVILQRFFALTKATRLLSLGSDYTQAVVGLVVGAAGLLLFWLTRQTFYFWFAVNMALSGANLPIRMASEHFSWTFFSTIYCYVLTDVLGALTLAFFIFGSLGLRSWKLRVFVVVMELGMESGPMLVLGHKISLTFGDSVYFVFSTIVQAMLVWLLVRGWRTGNVYARLLLFPYALTVLMSFLSSLGHVLVNFNVPHGGSIISTDIDVLTEPFRVTLNDVGAVVATLGMLAVLVYRFAQTSREQQRLASALQAAHDIQQRLVPVDIPSLGGLHTEIVYLAAEEVGGDFCQVLPRPDGSIFVAIGDVSGKGLQAAMIGTVAVGALRSMADEEITPPEALDRLNRVLLRTENAGFITCLCLVLTAEGGVTVANAGHLSPYLDGVELPLANGLPLGIIEGVAFEQSTFLLPEAARLTLLSDGVVEARSSTGALFGFERTSEVSQLAAKEIADQAHRYGQEDDITVITMDWRSPVLAHA